MRETTNKIRKKKNKNKLNTTNKSIMTNKRTQLGPQKHDTIKKNSSPISNGEDHQHL